MSIFFFSNVKKFVRKIINPKNIMIPIRCVVTGDGTVGKTSLLLCYTANRIPSEFVPTTFDHQTKNIVIEETQISLEMWDSAGHEDYERVRHLIYQPKTDVVILCFSLVSPKSLENIENIWVPEIKQYCPNTPYVLAGLKSDLRDEFDENSKEFISKGMEKITKAKGEEMKQKINAFSYVECSSLRQKNVNDVFETACKAFLSQNEKTNNNSHCLLS